MAELVFFRRGEEMFRVALGLSPTLLGRGDNCDVAIPDPEVSRQQARVSVHDGQAVLEDASGRGTLVAGERQTKVTLADGMDISLGQWRGVFRTGSATSDTDATELRVVAKTAVQNTATPAEPVGAQLRIRHHGKERTQRFAGELMVVGKDLSCDVMVDDPFISAKHARLKRNGDRFLITDLGSTNGTWHGPLRISELEVPLGTGFRVGEAELVFESLRAQSARDTSAVGLIGNDLGMRQVAEMIARVAPSDAAIAIVGESGTGKELVAQALHLRSARADRAFIPVNCAAISKELIESELFGHEKGAFTGATNAREGAFEAADKGTIFLDEIGELPAELQAKLLRVLESGEIKRVGASKPSLVDARVVCATNRDLRRMVREGTFREDLYFRLCVVPLFLPPLRQRKGDIKLLAQHFLKGLAKRGAQVQFTPAALARLEAHHWPGNVRELKNVVHRSLLLRKSEMIDAHDLSFDAELMGDIGVTVAEPTVGATLEQMMAKVERDIIEATLKRLDNNRERAARELGISRSSLFKRLKEWGLTTPADALGDAAD